MQQQSATLPVVIFSAWVNTLPSTASDFRYDVAEYCGDQADMNTGTVICCSRLRVTPPNTASCHRE
jgi:hypothetical protein